MEAVLRSRWAGVSKRSLCLYRARKESLHASSSWPLDSDFPNSLFLGSPLPQYSPPPLLRHSVVSCRLELRGRNAVPTRGGPARVAGLSPQHPCLFWQESSENSKLGPSEDHGLDWMRNWLSDFSNPYLGGFNMQLGLQSRGLVDKIHVFSFTF